MYFDLHESTGSGTLGQMAYTVENMFVTGSLTFTSHAGSPLNVQAGSFSFSQKTSRNIEKGDDKGRCHPQKCLYSNAFENLHCLKLLRTSTNTLFDTDFFTFTFKPLAINLSKHT